MAHSSQSTLPTLISVSQWNALETFNINEQRDGNFKCSGVKNNTTDPCGWNIRGQKAEDISDLLDDMSRLPPQSAIPSLNRLAKLTLCMHHEKQAARKVRDWTAAIDHLSRFTQVEPTIAGTHTPSPQRRTALNSESTPSLQPESNVSTFSPGSATRSHRIDDRTPTQKTKTVTVEEELHRLRKEIELLTARIVFLELDRRETTKAASLQVTSPPSTRSGLRSGWFGRNHN